MKVVLSQLRLILVLSNLSRYQKVLTFLRGDAAFRLVSISWKSYKLNEKQL